MGRIASSALEPLLSRIQDYRMYKINKIRPVIVVVKLRHPVARTPRLQNRA